MKKVLNSGDGSNSSVATSPTSSGSDHLAHSGHNDAQNSPEVNNRSRTLSPSYDTNNEGKERERSGSLPELPFNSISLTDLIRTRPTNSKEKQSLVVKVHCEDITITCLCDESTKFRTILEKAMKKSQKGAKERFDKFTIGDDEVIKKTSL